MGALYLTSLLLCAHVVGVAFASGDVGNMIQNLQTFFQLKAGNGEGAMSPVVWYYSGWLRSAMTGSEVVGVEGVEMIQPVANHGTTVSTTAYWERSYLSKKLMAFVHKDNKTDLITRHRIRKLSPERKVNPIKTYTEKVSLCVNASGRPVAKIEWPGSKRVIRSHQFHMQPVPEASWLDSLIGRKKLQVTHSISGITDEERRRSSRSGFSWGRWVSWGPTNDAQRTGRTQESYTIGSATSGLPHRSEGTQSAQGSAGPPSAAQAMRGVAPWRSWFASKPEAILTYRRYGEAPPWLAVGQPCIIDLTGYRYPNRRRLPAHVQELVKRVDPTFFDFTVPLVVAASDRSESLPKAGVANAPPAAPLRRRRGQGEVTLEWFAAQRDPAAAYVPWYRKAFNRVF